MPREPRHSSGRGRTHGPDAAKGAEPLVRLASLASGERLDPATPPTYEERLGAMIKRASPPREMEAPGLDRQWRRLSHRQRLRPWRHPGFSLRWAVALALLLVSGGILAAQAGEWTWPGLVARTVAHTVGRGWAGVGRAVGGANELASRSPPRRRSAGAPVVAASPSPLPLVPPPLTDVPSIDDPVDDARPPTAVTRRAPLAINRGPALARVRVPPLSPGPPVSRQSVLAEESASLSRALVSLRQGHDAAAALVELDEYARRYPGGTLAREAEDARVDALLMAERWSEARSSLARMTLGTGARDVELRLIRAELAVDASSCGAAFDDFQFVLTHSRAQTLAERALWGRAACRSRMGDEAGARADLAAYVAQFPNGARTAAARARLAP